MTEQPKEYDCTKPPKDICPKDATCGHCFWWSNKTEARPRPVIIPPEGAAPPNPWYCPYQHVDCVEGGESHCDWPCNRWFVWHDAAIAQAAREKFVAAIMRESPDTIQATEDKGDVHAWNAETITRVLESLRQKEVQ